MKPNEPANAADPAVRRSWPKRLGVAAVALAAVALVGALGLAYLAILLVR